MDPILTKKSKIQIDFSDVENTYLTQNYLQKKHAILQFLFLQVKINIRTGGEKWEVYK